MVALVAPAQTAIQAGAMTRNDSHNNGCKLSARQVVIANNGTEVRSSSRNNGSTRISFGAHAALTLSDGNRTVSTMSVNEARPPGDGVMRMAGTSPALAGSLTAATVTTARCSTAPKPGGPPRSWREIRCLIPAATDFDS